MATKHVQQYKLDNYEESGPDSAPENISTTWVRNPSWLPMPTVTAADEKFCALVAVYEDSPIAFPQFSPKLYFGADTPLYWRVDWGDGVEQTYLVGSNVYFQSSYRYNYTDSFLNGTNAPVTISTTEIQRTAHGYSDGMEVKLHDLTGPTNVREEAIYYVVNSSTNSFQLSETVGGTAIVFNATGSANLLPYKQAVITITCDAQIDNMAHPLSTANIDNVIQPGQSTSFGADANVLEMSMSFPNLNSGLDFSQVSYSNASSYINFRTCEQVSVYNLGSAIGLSHVFAGFYSLASVPVLNIPNSVTSLPHAFANCSNLEFLPANLNTSNVTDFTHMFQYCYTLKKLPFMDTSKAVHAFHMFYNCHQLQEIPPYDFSNVVYGYNMFYNCYKLKKLPNLKFSKNLVFADSMFGNCRQLKKVPYIDFTEVVRAGSLFYGCYALEEVPVLNLPKATNTSSMFQNCPSLKKVTIHAPLSQYTANMFISCKSLTAIRGTFNSIQDSYQMFYTCMSLHSLEDVDFTGSQPKNCYNMFYECISLKKIPYIDFSKTSTTYAMFQSCRSIEDLSHLTFTNTVKSAWSMFGYCYTLQKLPLLDLSNSVLTYDMFSHCFSLRDFPAVLNLQSSVRANSMFYNCYSMEYAPKLNFSSLLGSVASGVYLSNMFRECYSLKYIPDIPNLQNITYLNLAFYRCYSLKEMPAMDLSGLTLQSNNDFATSKSLLKFNVTAYSPNVNLYLYWGSMDATSLNEVYTMLPDLTGLTGRTITVTGQAGVASDNPTIATNKNWTVVG